MQYYSHVPDNKQLALLKGNNSWDARESSLRTLAIKKVFFENTLFIEFRQLLSFFFRKDRSIAPWN